MKLLKKIFQGASSKPAMKFTIERTFLLKTLSHMQSIVEKRDPKKRYTIPVLSNVKIEAKGNMISFNATDMDIEITELVEAKISGEGSTTVPAHMLYDIVQKFPDGSNIEFTYPNDNCTLSLTSGCYEFSLFTIGAEDFPAIPKDTLPINFEINKDELKTLIDRTQFSAGVKEDRDYLNGLYIHSKAPVLRFVTTDGHRLACAESPLPKGAEEITKKLGDVIIPNKSVLEIRKLLDDASTENVSIALSENKVRISFENVTLTSKLIDASFPDYERVIPTNNDKILEVNTKELLTAIDHISVITEKNSCIRLTTDTNRIIITASNNELGNATTKINAKYDNESIDIGYNFHYLLDILTQIKGNKVRFSLLNSSAATVINDTSDNSAIYVLMPMRA